MPTVAMRMMILPQARRDYPSTGEGGQLKDW
jgi:hypothetical protein